MKAEGKKRAGILPGLVCAFSLCFLLFVYAPFELYLTNQLEFWFTAGQLFKPALLLFCGVFVLLSLLLLLARRIGERAYAGLLAALWLALLCTWIQGSYLVFDLPALNGTEVWWGGFPLDRAMSIGLWLVLGAGVVLLLKKLGAARFARVVLFGSLAVLLLLALTLGGLFLTTDLTAKERAVICTDKDEFVYSPDENLLLLVLDAVDGRAFSQVLARDPSYPEIFEDFTCYTNTMGGYPYSKCSIPLILTGERYEAEQDFLDYERQAVQDAPLLTRLEREGWSRRIYTDDPWLLASVDAEDFQNLTTDQPEFGSLAHSCKLVLKMMLVKHAPWDLKFLGYDLPGRLREHVVYGGGGAKYFDWSDLLFYRALREENPIVTGTEKCFKYLHLEGAHQPHVYDKDLNVLESSPYRDVIEGNLTMLKLFLQRMKEAGVYDNTAIVILSDHGSSNTTDLVTLNQHTMLLIKGKNERHPFRTDDAPLSYDDMQQALLKLLDGESSQELFPWKEGDARQRRFLDYALTDSDILTEYIQTGHAEEMETLLPTGRVLEYKK